MYKFVRPILFRRDAEEAHEKMMDRLEALSRRPRLTSLLARRRKSSSGTLSQRLWDLSFRHPVGLAAGFDKDARAVPALFALGFAFVETGTVTPRPQDGNPRPRLFRLIEDEALINRLGFNNGGIDAVAANLALWRRQFQNPDGPGPVGLNLGKNRITPEENAVDDYVACLEGAFGLADYFVVNVSSPNTPGLRDLQDPRRLHRLLETVAERRDSLAKDAGGPVPPLLVKIAPDLNDQQLRGLVEAAEGARVEGYIATNTTVDRTGLKDALRGEQGGLSGRPLTEAAARITGKLYTLTEGKKPIIGVGGIFNGADAYRRIRAGASLLQIYTGFVYGGPGVPGSIASYLETALEKDGFQHIKEAVGVDAEKETV